jgi:hypothetical protein
MPCTHRVMLPNEISNRTRNSCRAVLIGSQAARLGPLVTPTGLVTADGPYSERGMRFREWLLLRRVAELEGMVLAVEK